MTGAAPARAAGEPTVTSPAARRAAGERGSGTVLWLGVVGVVLATFLGLAVLGAALVASHRAHGAADAAALAGAQAALDGLGPQVACERAADLAAANGARLAGCAAGADEVTVDVEVDPGLSTGLGPARARSRAGDPALAPR